MAAMAASTATAAAAAIVASQGVVAGQRAVLQTEHHKILIDVKLAAHVRFLFVSAAAINNLL